MNRLDELQAQFDARMDELSRRIDQFGTGAARMDPPPGPTPPPAPVPPPAPAPGPEGFAQRTEFPMDDSAAPSLRREEIGAVSDYDIRATGVPPGTPPPFETASQWWPVAKAMSAADMTVGHAVLTVPVPSGGKKQFAQVSEQVFPRQTVLKRGVPRDPSGDVEELLYRVGRAAAYYALRWRYRRIDDITAMWAYAEARLDDSRSRIERVGHFDNAYCSPRPGNRTVLCFSRKTNDQDTAGHEFTHAVTQETVDWIAYRNTTGAVNESFSDIFAKFVRWAWEGRELHDSQRWIYGGIRDMAHPDRLRNEKADWYPASYYLQKPTAERPRSGWFPTDSDFDHGGVHLNNGVIARLCFLLCEGEKVVRDNGWTGDVRPIGFERTEELFGTLLFAKRRYLPRATTMHALCNGILLAARDLEFGSDEFRRLRMACDAVNILPKESAGSRHGPAERHVAMKADNARSAGGESSAARSVAAAFAEELGLDAPGAGYVVAGDAPLGPPGRFPEDRAWGDPEEREVVLEQTWRGIPVYGASAIARVREGVATYLQNGFSRSLGRLGGAKDRIGADGAGRIALERSAGGHVARLEQVVWDPAVLEEAGVPALAWHVETAVGDAPEKQWVIDAESGAILLEAPLRTS